jgi:kinesin family protein 3/17
LLSKDVKFKYELKESADKGVYVKDLNMMVVKTVKEMDMFLECGNSKRSTGQTLMNAESSRSHSIFTLYVEQSIKDNKENERITLGKLNLVDLAGSERLSKTGA